MKSIIGKSSFRRRMATATVFMAVSLIGYESLMAQSVIIVIDIPGFDSTQTRAIQVYDKELVSYQSNSIVGLATNLSNSDITIYPNPVKDHMTISFSTNLEFYGLQIMDASGSVVYRYNYSNSKNRLVLDLQPGLYYISISTSLGNTTKNFNIIE